MSSPGGPAVLLVTRNLDIGGAQENTLTMAKYLPRVDCPTVVCTFADGPLRPEVERLGVPVEVLPGRRRSVLALPWFVAEMLRIRRDLVGVVRRHRIDVVQARGLGTLDFLVLSLRIGHRARVWWTIENVVFMIKPEHQVQHRWLYRPKLAAHRLLYRVGARFADGVIAVSDETERSFRTSVGYRGSNLVVVPNAVDVERYPAAADRDEIRGRLGLGPDEHAMIMVGTFKRQKGHRVLIDAAARIMPGLPRLRLLLVGDGELAPEVRAQVEAAGLADRVRFLGSRRDVPELLAASDSFVLPSLWEGLPVALVEAMASGLPIVATRVSGTSQVMVDGETGRIVPASDVRALAEAIAEVVTDPAGGTAMAAAARRRVVDSFGALGQAERLASLFRAAAPVRAPSAVRWPTRSGSDAA